MEGRHAANSGEAAMPGLTSADGPAPALEDRRVCKASSSAPVLAIENVSFAYSRERLALDRASFTVPPGRFTALLGPNGAGKTTLMSLVTRLFTARSGRILVSGRDLSKDPRAALAAMGVVFQRPTVDPDLTVEQNLFYAARLYGLRPAAARARVSWALSRLNVTDRSRSPVRSLSGGLRRRVELARALVHDPVLLILDEPTVGLDIDSRRDIVLHVHDLCARENLAVLWTTHLIDEILPMDRVVVIDRGNVKAEGDVETVVANAGAADLADAYRRLTGKSEPTSLLRAKV
ncbi:ABC-2 type transport system ATP-binding protein [Arboricoccus pini]|uniref:ABC-2 type transport system ATP-binding protein n=1 Tax=Arboricoccus pini TaxID=1963835 RepID=A0A212QUF8_9PROT|nr:ATP-binding cassette domain-containing protein [Arboricoccus pini]SNB63184.1 ABC-2 type transport system ATP-binding protein [Arboricoccus pini]